MLRVFENTLLNIITALSIDTVDFKLIFSLFRLYINVFYYQEIIKEIIFIEKNTKVVPLESCNFPGVDLIMKTKPKKNVQCSL